MIHQLLQGKTLVIAFHIFVFTRLEALEEFCDSVVDDEVDQVVLVATAFTDLLFPGRQLEMLFDPVVE